MSSGGGMRGQGQGRGRGNRGSGNGGYNGGGRPPASNGNGGPPQGGGRAYNGGGGGPSQVNTGPVNWAQKAGGASGGNWPTPAGSANIPGGNGPAPAASAPSAWGGRGNGSGPNGPPAGRGQPGLNGNTPGRPSGNGPPGPSRGNGLPAGERGPEGCKAARGQREPRRPKTIAPPDDLPPEYSRDDIVETKVTVKNEKGEVMTKRGSAGEKVNIVSNYFTLLKKTDWNLFQYKVDFKPDEHTTKIRKALFRDHADKVGIHMFDGYHLYTVHRLHPDPLTLHSKREDESVVELNVRMVDQIAPCDPTMLHFFNIIIRKCLQGLKLNEIGRNFFDGFAKIKHTVGVDRNGNNGISIEFWPGYVTSMRQCENDVLLRVEIKHKLVRTDSVLKVISNIPGGSRYKENVKTEVVDSIVMTGYNSKTYKISDVEFNKTPTSTFDYKGKQTTYISYYKSRYNETIREPNQPLLVALPTKKDMHRGETELIYLIPELCQTTGLTDRMRANNGLMRDIASHLHISPTDRAQRVEDFMRRIRDTTEVQAVLNDWGMKFSHKLVDVPGRTMKPERIYFAPRGAGGQKTVQDKNDRHEWTLQSRDYPMMKNATLNTWIIIVGERDQQHVGRMVATMREVAGQLGFQIPNPAEVYPLRNVNPDGFTRAIQEAMNDFSGKIDLIFTLLPTNKVETYSAIKRQCYLEFGVSSQVFLAKNVNNKNFKSIATKLVIQMNAKLGGIPWEVEVPGPLNDTMMVGFDVYHCAGKKGRSVGALVASTNMAWGEYFSTTSTHSNGNELAANLCTDMKKALNAYAAKNNCLPLRIIFFRDGVGEGQLSYVFRIELEQIKTALLELYTARNMEPAKFTFIVVTKRIETRLFARPRQGQGAQFINPVPGTVVDDVITLPERHDFYLVSQTTRNGTVSPTAYHVLYNDSTFTPGQLQSVAYKMCHLYFNCSTSVAVPAPCQYAHKLAFLSGVSLGEGQCQQRLLNQLYYL